MAYNPNNPNGQATSANSSPVVIASDQSTVKVKLASDIANTTGTITSAASAVTATDMTGIGSATIQIKGTYAGVNFTVEGSPDAGTTWTAVPFVALGSTTPNPIIATGVLGSNATAVYNVSPLLGIDQLRVRATAWTSGTANIIIHPSTQFVNSVQPITGGVTATLTSTTLTSVVPGVGATNLGKAEDAAHTTADVGVFSLGIRNDTMLVPTSATNDYSQLSVGPSGEVLVAGAPRLLKARQVTTLTSTTTETTIVTAIASTFCDIYGLILSNISATATEVTIRDATAGGTISSFMVPAGDTRGFMLPLDSAIPQATVNNNWTAQCGTSVASLKVTALYIKRV